MIPREAVEAAAKAYVALCGGTWEGSRYREVELSYIRAALEAAAPFIRAEALRQVAERFKARSDTLHNTMKEMTASREYGVEDIVRYGAYSAEANTTATWLRARAAEMRQG